MSTKHSPRPQSGAKIKKSGGPGRRPQPGSIPLSGGPGAKGGDGGGIKGTGKK